jgi:hypothetical protein
MEEVDKEISEMKLFVRNDRKVPLDPDGFVKFDDSDKE